MRKPRVYDPSLPLHLTARTANQKPFPIPPEDVWRVYEDYLFMLHHGFNVNIFAFVQMSNHFHMLARFPDGNMGDAMNYFQRETSKAINRLAGQINQIYGGRYHSTIMRHEFHVRLAYRYVYLNPVRARICHSFLDYRHFPPSREFSEYAGARFRLRKMRSSMTFILASTG